MIEDHYDSPVAHIIREVNGIFICKLKDTRIAYDTHEIKNHFDFFIKHSQGKPYKVILDTTASFNFPTDCAFDYFIKNNDTKNTFAIVTNTLSMRLLLEQTFRLHKVNNSLFFRTLEAASEWIIRQ